MMPPGMRDVFVGLIAFSAAITAALLAVDLYARSAAH